MPGGRCRFERAGYPPEVTWILRGRALSAFGRLMVNTPCRISDSRDVRVYCMYGNVRQLGSRPMLEVVNSESVVGSQLRAFRSADFPHLAETRGQQTYGIPSSKTCALFID